MLPSAERPAGPAAGPPVGRTAGGFGAGEAARWTEPASRGRRPGWVTALLALALLLGTGSVVMFVGIIVVHSIGAGGGCGGG